MESGFFLILPAVFADASGMNTNDYKQASDNAIGGRPSDDICPERLAESGRAVADLAHMVKNIIQVLSGCGEIIDLGLETSQFDRVRQAWQLYKPNFKRLKKFQVDLIKFTKNYPLEFQSCDVGDIFAAAVKEEEAMLSALSVEIVTKMQNNLPTVVADGEKLRDAVVNLLIAAGDNLQGQAGQVTLDARIEGDEQAIVVSVSDSGPRLDEAMCRMLLSPGERPGNMVGVGLEVPLAKQVIEAHGGSLTINADVADAGNTFAMTLLNSS